MIDPDSPAYAEWSHVQRGMAGRCVLISQSLALLRAMRDLTTSPETRARLTGKSKAELLASLTDRGNSVWRIVAPLDKPALIDWLVTDRLARLNAKIAEQEQELADNQPSPYWQPEKEA